MNKHAMTIIAGAFCLSLILALVLTTADTISNLMARQKVPRVMSNQELQQIRAEAKYRANQWLKGGKE